MAGSESSVAVESAAIAVAADRPLVGTRRKFFWPVSRYVPLKANAEPRPWSWRCRPRCRVPRRYSLTRPPNPLSANEPRCATRPVRLPLRWHVVVTCPRNRSIGGAVLGQFTPVSIVSATIVNTQVFESSPVARTSYAAPLFTITHTGPTGFALPAIETSASMSMSDEPLR